MGLMSRILQSTGTASSDGLLHRAMELRGRIQQMAESAGGSTAVAPEPIAEQKKKSLRQF